MLKPQPKSNDLQKAVAYSLLQAEQLKKRLDDAAANGEQQRQGIVDRLSRKITEAGKVAADNVAGVAKALEQHKQDAAKAIAAVSNELESLRKASKDRHAKTDAAIKKAQSAADGANGANAELAKRVDGYISAANEEAEAVALTLIDTNNRLDSGLADARMLAKLEAEAVRGEVAKTTNAIADLFDRVDQRIKSIKQWPKPKDGKDGLGINPRGDWRPLVDYKKGDVVTHDGQGWLAKKDSRNIEPSETSADWQLIAAKGENGKDARWWGSGGGGGQVSPLAGYVLSDEDPEGTIDYYGHLKENDPTVWYIRKIDHTGDQISHEFATPADNPSIADYDAAWADRANLVYKRFSEVDVP